MNVVPIKDPNVWRGDKAAELQLSEREMEMVRAFEMIATGRSGSGASVDLEIARDIAREALERIGWPTAKKNTPGT